MLKKEPADVKPLLWLGSTKKDYVFQKKAKRGAATPKQDIDLVKDRLKAAEQMVKELSK